MRTSKYVGFFALVLGALVIAFSAALPISFTSDGGRVPRLTLTGDDCGPAVYAAVHRSDSPCRRAAQRRLLGFTTTGLVLVAVGLVLFAGGDSRGSRVVPSTGRGRRTPGSRRAILRR